MDRSRWISLAIVVACIAFDLFVLGPRYGGAGQSPDEPFPGQKTGCVLLGIAFVLVWWPDVAGAVFLHARFGPLPDSLAFVARIVGWILLIVAVGMRLRLLNGPT